MENAHDARKATTFHTMACNLRVSRSCIHLGKKFLYGQGAPKDPSKAKQMFFRACTMRNAEGCNGLGFLYTKGLGVSKDEYRAADYYAQACQLGDEAGCRSARRLAPKKDIKVLYKECKRNVKFLSFASMPEDNDNHGIIRAFNQQLRRIKAIYEQYTDIRIRIKFYRQVGANSMDEKYRSFYTECLSINKKYYWLYEQLLALKAILKKGIQDGLDNVAWMSNKLKLIKEKSVALKLIMKSAFHQYNI